MTTTTSFLIIGPAGRFRDALQTILLAIVDAAQIYTASDFNTGYALAVRRQPSVVIVDGGQYLDSDCQLFKLLLSRSHHSRCIVIANTMQMAVSAQQSGADAVLLQGFTLNTLRDTLFSLNVLPHTGTVDRLPASISQQPTAVPLPQKS